MPQTRIAAIARLALAPLVLIGLGGCFSLYGANFGYPDEVPVPHSAKILVTDKGQDDDDPMRARERVIDLGDGTLVELLGFYSREFPASERWKPIHVTGDQKLCLVNHSNGDYTELVEVFPYGGSRVKTSPGRYLVVISRFETAQGCGGALGWIPSDLL